VLVGDADDSSYLLLGFFITSLFYGYRHELDWTPVTEN
jgi:hypothetical protein